MAFIILIGRARTNAQAKGKGKEREVKVNCRRGCPLQSIAISFVSRLKATWPLSISTLIDSNI